MKPSQDPYANLALIQYSMKQFAQAQEWDEDQWLDLVQLVSEASIADLQLALKNQKIFGKCFLYAIALDGEPHPSDEERLLRRAWTSYDDDLKPLWLKVGLLPAHHLRPPDSETEQNWSNIGVFPIPGLEKFQLNNKVIFSGVNEIRTLQQYFQHWLASKE